MSSTPTATFGLLLSAVGLRCLVTAAFLGCGLGAGLAYGQRWGIFVSGSGDGLMAICGDCSVAAHTRHLPFDPAAPLTIRQELLRPASRSPLSGAPRPG